MKRIFEDFHLTQETIDTYLSMNQENRDSVEDFDKKFHIVINYESDFSGDSNLDFNDVLGMQTANTQSEESELLQCVKEEITVEYGVLDEKDLVKDETVEGKLQW